MYNAPPPLVGLYYIVVAHKGARGRKEGCMENFSFYITKVCVLVQGEVVRPCCSARFLLINKSISRIYFLYNIFKLHPHEKKVDKCRKINKNK